MIVMEDERQATLRASLRENMRCKYCGEGMERLRYPMQHVIDFFCNACGGALERDRVSWRAPVSYSGDPIAHVTAPHSPRSGRWTLRRMTRGG